MYRVSEKNDVLIGGREYWRKHPQNASNGSLMRNGAVAALCSMSGLDVFAAFDTTCVISAMTNFQPLTVICCLVHTKIIYDGFNKVEIELNASYIDSCLNLVKEWAASERKGYAGTWLKDVGGIETIKKDSAKLYEELKDFYEPENFNPYDIDYRGKSGYSVLTLKISLWGLRYALGQSEGIPVLPEYLKPFAKELFENRRGFDCIIYIVLIGADADTYGATCGPLLAAFFDIPQNFLGITALGLIKRYLEK